MKKRNGEVFLLYESLLTPFVKELPCIGYGLFAVDFVLATQDVGRLLYAEVFIAKSVPDECGALVQIDKFAKVQIFQSFCYNYFFAAYIAEYKSCFLSHDLYTYMICA